VEKALIRAWPEAADALSVGRSKLWELIASGELESVKIGHSRLVPSDAITDYVRKLRAKSSRDNAA